MGNLCVDRPAGRVEQEPEDQALLERFCAGDREALGDLADRYAARLYNFGLRMCGNSADAQDMVQDTFLNVIRYLKGFRGETKLKNWLFRLASSACLKKRRGKYDPDRELPLEALYPGHDPDVPSEIPDWTQNPADELINDELRLYLARSIERLPPNYRMVFTLRDLEGFSTAEVGEMLKPDRSNRQDQAPSGQGLSAPGIGRLLSGHGRTRGWVIVKESCLDHFERLSELIDGELDQITGDRIRAHLEACPHCRACWATFKKSVEIFQYLGSDPIPSEVLTEIKAFIRSYLAS